MLRKDECETNGWRKHLQVVQTTDVVHIGAIEKMNEDVLIVPCKNLHIIYKICLMKDGVGIKALLEELAPFPTGSRNISDIVKHDDKVYVVIYR